MALQKCVNPKCNSVVECESGVCSILCPQCRMKSFTLEEEVEKEKNKKQLLKG